MLRIWGFQLVHAADLAIPANIRCGSPFLNTNTLRIVARPPLPYFVFIIHNAGRVKIDIYKKVRVWHFHFIRMRRTGRDHLVGCRSPILGLGPSFCRASAISTLFCTPRILHIISLLFLLNLTQSDTTQRVIYTEHWDPGS
jgi:hypothetical protein